MFVGVDVGAAEGFHVAALDAHGTLQELRAATCALEAANVVTALRPTLVAVDSPRRPAPAGHGSRWEERMLARTVRGIRFTPDAAALGLPSRAAELSGYHGWIRNGLVLYELLRERQVVAVECFPTASWIRLVGPREHRTRAAWTRLGLARLGLAGLPGRTNQDERDAICAAVTARAATRSDGAVEWLGEICVPRARTQVARSPGGRAPGRSSARPTL